MDFTAYVQKQINLVRSRHCGETFLVEKGEVFPVGERERLLSELNGLKGLNKEERSIFYRRFA